MSVLPTAGPRAPRTPSVEIETGPTLTGTHLRGGLAVSAAALAAVALLAVGAQGPAPWVVGVVAGAVLVWRPEAPVPQLLVALSGLLLLLDDTSFSGWAFVLLPLGHLTLRASWWAAHVPPRARVERAALLPDTRRALVVQGAAQLLALLALAVTRLPGSSVAVLVGGAALLALAYLVVPREWWR